jgi:hypothetical protein
MKQIFTAFVLFMTMTMAMAVTPHDMSKLSEVQKAELALQVAKQVEEAGSVTSPKQVKEWVSYGSEIGKAMAGAARELGVVANEFIQTPAGQITMAMIVWKIMGHDIVHVGLALIMFFTLVPGWFYMFNRMCVVKGYEYLTREIDGKTKTIKVKKYYDPTRDDIVGIRLLMALVLFFILLAVILVGIN